MKEAVLANQRMKEASDLLSCSSSSSEPSLGSSTSMATTTTTTTTGSLSRDRSCPAQVPPRNFPSQIPPSLEAFRAQRQQARRQTDPETWYPLAWRVEKDVPIYRSGDFDLMKAGDDDGNLHAEKEKEKLERLKDELYHILTAGPGVYVIKGFFTDLSILDSANVAFEAILAREREQQTGEKKKGDHFAPASANARIWNSFQKHGEQDPRGFLEYYANPWFALVCDSFLGPGYRLTAQMNTVRPGGQAQMPHRDYHLGFQTDADVVRWPRAVHAFSGLLTLQGAVAHTNMPLASGPTRLLPFSQNFAEGFRSYRRTEFVEYFLENYIALPLEKGDAVFFAPALFHAAGENLTSDFDRTANLIQVSSAFGKTMETIDTLVLIEKTYEDLRQMYRKEGMSTRTDSFIRAVAEGYPFPTNLDCRPPAPGGMAPESEQDILRRCIRGDVAKPDLMRELQEVRYQSSAGGMAVPQTPIFGT